MRLAADADVLELLASSGRRGPCWSIFPQQFHWESQSLTREASATGQRTIHHCERGREPRRRADRVGLRVAIRWRLHRAIPGAFYPELAVAV